MTASHYIRRPDIFFTVVDDEIIFLKAGEEQFLSSNMVATTVWTALEVAVSLPTICDEVLARFSCVDRATVEADVSQLLAELRDHKLLDVISPN